MPVVTIKFKMPEEDHDLQLALHAVDYQIALHDIANEVFRPHRKHGYSHQQLQKLINENPVCLEAISILEDMFLGIIKDLDIE